MAVLPQGASVDISGGVTFVQQPSKTWYINQTTNRIQGTIDGLDAVSQAVDIILNVERFRWQIYRPYSGTQWQGLIGRDPGYVGSELQRRIADALMVDDRIRGISDFTFSVSGNFLTASFTVNTVYGTTQSTVEVNLN